MAETSTTERPTRSTSSFINEMSREERKRYMRELGQRGNENRLVLSGEERDKLIAAYGYIGSIMRRHGLDGGAGK